MTYVVTTPSGPPSERRAHTASRRRRRRLGQSRREVAAAGLGRSSGRGGGREDLGDVLAVGSGGRAANCSGGGK